jgi:hypothetical protein
MDSSRAAKSSPCHVKVTLLGQFKKITSIFSGPHVFSVKNELNYMEFLFVQCFEILVFQKGH